MYRIARKCFFLLISLTKIQTFNMTPFCLKLSKPIIKTIMSIFKSHQTCKIELIKNCNIWNLSAIHLFKICIKCLRKDLRFLQIIPDKIYLENSKTAQNQTRAANFGIYFCVITDHQQQNVISPGETG